MKHGRYDHIKGATINLHPIKRNYAVGIHMLALTRRTTRKGDVEKNVMPRVTSSVRDTLEIITVVVMSATATDRWIIIIAFVIVVVRVGPTVGSQAIELITSLKGITFAPPGCNTLTHPIKSTTRGITTSAALDSGRRGTVNNACFHRNDEGYRRHKDHQRTRTVPERARGT